MNDNAILIVNDDVRTKSLLLQILQEEGYSPSVCSSGEEAVQKIQSGSFELVIIDLLLPSENVKRILKFLQKEDSQKSVMVMNRLEEKIVNFSDEDNINLLFSNIYEPVVPESFLNDVKSIVSVYKNPLNLFTYM